MLPVHVNSSFLQLELDYLPSNLSDLTTAPFKQVAALFKDCLLKRSVKKRWECKDFERAVFP